MSPPIHVEIDKRLGAFKLHAAFEAAPEGITALFGPSGAGKSQLLAAIAGASRPDAGRITLGDEILFDSARRVDTPMERRRIGWVFQDGRLFPHLSVAANLDYGAKRARGRDAGVRRGELLGALGIGALLDRAPASLSGGERQRVAIARALFSQPALLLMDEPLASLDLPRRAEILPYLERLKTLYRLPILYVTHALSEVVRLADRLVVLEAGRVSAQGPLRDVLTREDLPILAARPDAATPFDAVVLGHDQSRRLSRIDLGGGAALLTPQLPLAEGARTRLAVLARDVLLARTRPQDLSARNILPAVVEAIGPPRPDGVRLVRVRLEGGPPLQAALTGDAVEALALQPGTAVFAIVKSVAVEGVSPGGLVAAFEL